MEYLAIFGIIVFGFLLVLLEILVIPGTTISGIIGIASVLVGIYYSFQTLGTTQGTVVLLSTVVGSSILIYYSLKSKTWKKMQLNAHIDGKIELNTNGISVGDEGISISRIFPIGKAEIAGKIVEVKSYDGAISENSKIIVHQVIDNQVIVKYQN